MANTIKFGNGQWATKEDSILAYNDENANFKPLPFVTSRASTATRVNKAGLLETVASGIPRVDYLGNSKGSYLLEPASTNLITQSEAFANSYWTKTGASIEGDASTATGAELVTGWTNADYGTFTSFGLDVTSAVSTFHSQNFYSNIVTLEEGKTYQFSFTATGTLGVGLYLRISSSTTLNGAVFAEAITNVGNNTFAFTPSVTYTNYYVGMRNEQADGNYAVSGFTLKEVQGFSAPSVDSPLGAFKLVEGSANSQHRIDKNGLTVSSGASVTCSVYAKKGERNWIILYEASSSKGYFFDLVNGIKGSHFIGSPDSYSIISVGDYWRISVTSAVPSTVARFIIYNAKQDNEPSYTGDGTSGVYIFGAQLEQQSYATSYIPTKGSTQTRLRDSASKSGISSLINSEEGTLFVEMAALSDGDGGEIAVSDGTNNNSTRLVVTNGGVLLYSFKVGGVTQFALTTTIVPTDYNDISITWKMNEFNLYVNGVIKATSTTGNVTAANIFNTVSFRRVSDQYLEANVKNLQIFKSALTASQIAALTTI